MNFRNQYELKHIRGTVDELFVGESMLNTVDTSVTALSTFLSVCFLYDECLEGAVLSA